jgi:hypothetical protein
MVEEPAAASSADSTERVSALLSSPMALWLLASTVRHWREYDELPRGPVGMAGTDLEAALTDPGRLMWLTFQHVGSWPYHYSRIRAADLLECRPFFRDAARALATAPAAQWWWEPLRRNDQTWFGHPVAGRPPIPHAVDLASKPDDPALPVEGMFTSTRLGALPGAYLAGWDGPPDTLSIWQVPVLDSARVYEIHGPADWRRLVERYRDDQAPDWYLVSDDDGVHLSMAGWLTVPECAMWLHEATLWLNPAFGEVARLPDWPYTDLWTNYDWPTPPWPAEDQRRG